MRRFLIQTCSATLAEGVEFTDGTCCVVSLIEPLFRALFPTLEHVEAHYTGDGLAQVVLLDGEL